MGSIFRNLVRALSRIFPDCVTLSQAIAFNMFLAFFPMLLLALGLLGGTGLTAYFGMTDIAKVKAGDFVVVSGAAGATGSVACQIAKLKGATVLGLAGSEDKVKWLKELGCDEALNYKDPQFKEKFKAATKDLIDVFFDNVGGEILEAALSRAKPHARFVMCGAISQYNSAQPVGPKVCA